MSFYWRMRCLSYNSSGREKFGKQYLQFASERISGAQSNGECTYQPQAIRMHCFWGDNLYGRETSEPNDTETKNIHGNQVISLKKMIAEPDVLLETKILLR